MDTYSKKIYKMSSALPPEILEKTSALLPQKQDQILQCHKVCKAWIYPARKWIFEHNTLPSDSDNIQFLDLISTNTMIDEASTAALVKHITIDISNKNNDIAALNLISLVSIVHKCFSILALEFSKRTNPYYFLRTIWLTEEILLENIQSMKLAWIQRHFPSSVRKHYMLATWK